MQELILQLKIVTRGSGGLETFAQTHNK